MDIEVLIQSLPRLMIGLQFTLLLTFLSLILGTALGILLAMGRSFGKFPLSTIIYGYEKVFRGIPLLVIFFLLYFGLFEIGINLEPITAAVIGLGLRGAAYQAQIYRSAINSIPEGQTIAAQSIGMSKLQTIRYILLPQVMRLSIPGWSNEFTIVLKDTSIAFSIGVIELMRQGRYIYINHPNLILPVFIIIAAIYFILVIIANKSLGFLEKKYKMSGFNVSVER
ncbi:MAG: amino acid ABC transporter permease [Thermoplasmatota archaeon]